MSKVEIIYEAKCKHCKFRETLNRKTKCLKHSKLIRIKDLACKDFIL